MDEENTSEINKPSEGSTENKSMNPMIIGVVAAVLAVAVGFFLLTRNASDNSQLTESANQNQTEEIALNESSPASDSLDESAMQNASTISVEGGGFYFKPNEIRAKKGEKVTVEFKNAGGTHDFVIDELNVKSKLTNTGETATVEFTPTQAGEFEFYCSVANHRQQGMKGTLVVE